jgi:4-amino-4-deoxy-L-arabinose transferase-like glycosyltransferase
MSGRLPSAPSTEAPTPASVDDPPERLPTSDADAPHAARAAGRLRRLRACARRVPRAAWVCALLAVLNAACWSVLTPPFQAPDEPSHFAYAQLLAETGRLPSNGEGDVSQEEVAMSDALNQFGVLWHPEVKTISSPSALRKLHHVLDGNLNPVGSGGAGVATAEPPLYYALEAIPYHLASSGSLLDRLEAMRLLSALMAGLTALFAFLFVRELMPGGPWAWTVAGLAVALTPVLGFTSGVVTPDAMLAAVCAVLFYCLARAFRRGLTRRRATAIGAVVAIGFLTKLNFMGLVPGAMLGLLLLAFRGVRENPDGERSRRAFGAMAIAVGIAFTPVCVYVASNALEHHPLLGIVSRPENSAIVERTPLRELEYIWQFYLPRLPGMVAFFPGISVIRQLWWARIVGIYGWLDTTFPVWVYNFALIPAGLIVLLALRTLLERRGALRRHLSELVVYAAIAAGLLVLIAADSYSTLASEGPGYLQPRYLLPLLPLLAAVLAAGARGAGRRLGPAAGALIVTLFLAHDLLSQLLVVSRFYG